MSETAAAAAIDKSAWGPGAWMDEPDRVDFVYAGFACFLLRHERHGHLCGYVGVPREHPLHGKDYGDADVDVHGGLTYARACEGQICHVPAPGMPDDVWWLGFDCAHAGDASPGVDATLRLFRIAPRPPSCWDEVYRDVAYVRAETERLADQLRALAS